MTIELFQMFGFILYIIFLIIVILKISYIEKRLNIHIEIFEVINEINKRNIYDIEELKTKQNENKKPTQSDDRTAKRKNSRK